MFTIVPARRRCMAGSTACAQWNEPCRFTAIRRWQSSRFSTSSARRGMFAPAAFTRASIRWCFFKIAATAASTAAGSATSHRQAVSRFPRFPASAKNAWMRHTAIATTIKTTLRSKSPGGPITARRGAGGGTTRRG